MYDRKLVLTILGQIYQVSQTILKRFEPGAIISVGTMLLDFQNHLPNTVPTYYLLAVF